MQYICSVVELARLIFVGFLRRKFDMLTRVVHAGIRKKTQLLEFSAAGIISSPEFRFLMTESYRQELLPEPSGPQEWSEARVQEYWF